jgi:hypothetical protein
MFILLTGESFATSRGLHPLVKINERMLQSKTDKLFNCYIKLQVHIWAPFFSVAPFPYLTTNQRPPVVTHPL